jgi:DNA-binding NtrC family response regulator
MARILLIDDDPELIRFLKPALEEAGYEVECLEMADEVPRLLATGQFDLVLLDNRMPGMSGIECLPLLRQRGLSVMVILMTGHGTADTAIQAMREGAFDYVIKPQNYECLFRELEPIIDQALSISRSMRERVPLPGTELNENETGPALRGESRPMQEVYKLIGRVAKSEDAVLIRGETGTGKELVARAIHSNSPRRNKPFVAMNCTASNENLLDDELFGHEPGSFTGAEKLRKGRFEYANGGTLFLDEVGDMPFTLQAKLLRVLENKEVSRVGSNENIKIDVRIVSATHCDLENAIREGKFRQDLFFRLTGATIFLPPLRERGADIKLLAEYLLKRIAQATGRRLAFHPKTLEKLLAFSWEGNVRQLQNVVRQAARVCRGAEILPEDLEFGGSLTAGKGPGETAAVAGMHQAIAWALSTGQTNLYPLLHDMLERELLKLTLDELDGNQAQVAKRLGIARNTVRARIQSYGLEGSGDK